MNDVAIIDCDTSKFSRSSDEAFFEKACEPCVNILGRQYLEKEDIDAVLFSSCSVEQYSASIVSEMLGLRPKVCHRIDNLCSSGTNAIVSAFSHIASGLCDTVLVVGAEEANTPGRKLNWDVTRGEYGLPIFWASLFAKAHMNKYGTTEEQMALVSARNHLNATKNPNALFRKPITPAEVLKSRAIAPPLKLLDCSSLCTGSSALLLASKSKAKILSENPVWIRGIGQRTSGASFSKIGADLTSIIATREAAEEAYKMAEIKPSGIDVAELHDAFSILEILAYEDLKFAKKGEGGKFVEQDEIIFDPRGGILGCGHPIGATGVAQTAEIVLQLGNRAEQRQVKGCKAGLVQNLAAAGTSATVLVLGVDS